MTMLLRSGRNVSLARDAWQILMACLGMLLLLIAAARPQWGMRDELVRSSGRDIVIALDVSLSMLANDVHPNRLQRAKTDILDLIKELRGDRAALLTFRHKANLVCPLTTDYAFLRQTLESTGPDSAPRGETDLGDAIVKALQSFDQEGASHKAIVLISDGEDLSGRALECAKLAAEKKIPVFTVGLGSPQGSRIPDPEENTKFLRHADEDVRTSLDHETLLAVAKATGGAYIPIQTAGMTTTTLGTLYRDYLRRITTQDIEETQVRRRIERYQLFILPAVILLLGTAALSRGRLKTGAPAAPASGEPARPPLKNLTPPATPLKKMALVLALLAGIAQAQPSTNAPATRAEGHAAARDAQRLYQKGQFKEAAAGYDIAASTVGPESRRRYQFNKAVSLYQAKQYPEAAGVLEELVRTGPKGSAAELAAALGAALYQASQPPGAQAEDDDPELRVRYLKEAADAFRQAARQSDTKSRRNLSIILERMEKVIEDARIAALLKRYGNMPPDQIANKLMRDQRRLAADTSEALADPSVARVTRLESLAARQNATTDLLIPLKGKLLQALQQQAGTNDVTRQTASVNQAIETTRDTMKAAFHRLRDLEPEAAQVTLNAAAASYQFWKAVAPIGALLSEDMLRQTNSIVGAQGGKMETEFSTETPLRHQQESADLTRVFRERFEQSVPESGIPPTAQSASDTNAPPADDGITPETRNNILTLTDETIKLQEAAAGMLGEAKAPQAVPKQQEACRLLKEIEKLLPRQQQQQQQQQGNEEEQQNQESRSEQTKESGESQQQEQENNQSSSTNTTENATNQTVTAQPANVETNKPDQASNTLSNDLRQILARMLMREREHEAEKRRRQERIPMSPSAKDW
jgi:Ca-activated chloride channel family protein